MRRTISPLPTRSLRPGISGNIVSSSGDAATKCGQSFAIGASSCARSVVSRLTGPAVVEGQMAWIYRDLRRRIDSSRRPAPVALTLHGEIRRDVQPVPRWGRAALKLFHFLTFASLSLWESRAEGPERAAAVLVVEFIAGSENPPRPLRGRPSRTREGEAKSSYPNGSKAARPPVGRGKGAGMEETPVISFAILR
jgi:hypothetical protein